MLERIGPERYGPRRNRGEPMTELPETMTAIEITAPGGPDVLKPCQRQVPVPREGEVLVKVEAAGVNRPDVVQRMGIYPAPPGASDLPGLEISGTVVALGAGVESEHLGQKVCALVAGGGYAEYAIARAEVCWPVPPSLSMEEAAAIPETLMTVWHNVFERGYAAPGEAILVHGGTSGIGTMAIKLGRLFGLEVIVTCGSDEKCADAQRIGAAHAINYKAADFVEEVARITGGKGVHLVLDMVAGSYVPRNLKCLREDGRHVTIAVQGGLVAEINMAYVMSRRLTLTGSTLRPRSNDFKALLAQEIYQNVWPDVVEGRLRPEMAKSFPLADAAAAHALMESGEFVGKIVLVA
jgi:NADPH:quinone reductase